MEIQCSNCGAIQILNEKKVCVYCEYPISESDRTISDNR